MKKSLFLFMLLLGSLPMFSQKVILDKTETDGSRIIMTESKELYHAISSYHYARFFLGYVKRFDGTGYYCLSLRVYEGKLQIDKGRKLLIKFEDGSIIELENMDRIGPASYDIEWHGSTPHYYVCPRYYIAEDQIKTICSNKVTKIRIEDNSGVVDSSNLKGNKFSTNLSKMYENIKVALSQNSSVYSGF